MSEIQTSAETAIKFDAFYPYVWIKNIGDADCYVSNHPNITAGGVDVAYLPKGEAVLIQTQTDTVYVLGTTTVECHAQGYADSPFLDTYSEGGAEPTLITKSITHNGTYDAEDDNADGYSSVEVNVQMQRVLLYDSGSATQGAPIQQSVNLLDNLSKYKLICVIWSTSGDNTSSTTSNSEVMADTEYLLDANIANSLLITGYNKRNMTVAFTDTTFNITSASAPEESSDYTPQLYRIYGYKW